MPDERLNEANSNLRVAAGAPSQLSPSSFTTASAATGAAALTIPAVSGGVPSMNASATVRPEQVKLFNPQLAAAIAQVREPDSGLPRSQIKVPIAPASDLTDETLFEDPADPAKKYYLPRYRLADDNNQFQVSMAADGAGCILTIHLEKYPAPSVRESARGAVELVHSVAVILKHRLRADDAAAGHKELAFQVAPEPAGCVAVLRVETKDQRDLLYQAITNPAYGTSLIVRRLFRVAIPLPPPPPPPDPIVSSGIGTLEGSWELQRPFDFDTGKVDIWLGDVVWALSGSMMNIRRLAPHMNAKIASLGRVDFKAVTAEQLKALSYSNDKLEGSVSSSEPLLIVTPNWAGGDSNHPIGVEYNGDWGKWAILNHDLAPMSDGAAFNIVRPREAVIYPLSLNIDKHCIFFDHPATNNNPGAILFVTLHWGGAYNNHVIGVWYDSGRGKWAVLNYDLAPMPSPNPFLNVFLHVEVRQPRLEAFIHRANSANTSGHRTYLDHPLTNNHPSAVLFVTQNWNGVYNNHNIAVWYDVERGKWAIINQDLTAMPDGATFNVSARQAGQDIWIHRANSANTEGHRTFLNLPGEPINVMTKGNVFAAHTNAGNYAKVQVLEYGSNLKCQWTTYKPPVPPPTTLFRETTRPLDCVEERSPFVFPPDLHPYIFRDLTADAGKVFRTIARQLFWGDRAHSFFQDPVERNVFYYLPDSFKLRRRPESPHYPFMSVSYTSADGTLEKSRAAIEFWAFPVVDAKRIESKRRNRLPEICRRACGSMFLKPGWPKG